MNENKIKKQIAAEFNNEISVEDINIQATHTDVMFLKIDNVHYTAIITKTGKLKKNSLRIN